MQRTSLKRAAATIVALAVCGAGSVAFAPSASAGEIPATLTAAPAPIIVNAPNQSASNLTVTVPGPALVNDTVDITVAQSTGDCTTSEGAAAAISWAAVPTDDNANVTGELVDECNAGALNNTLRLKFTAADADGTTIVLSNIKYNAGPATPAGPVKVSVNDLVAVPDDSNATVAQVDRIDGAVRANTAANIAKASATNGCADSVVLVNGNNFPDALAAGFLGVPILLVDTDSVPAPTKAALEDLGVKNVTIVGGTSVVTSNVFNTVDNYNETAPAGCDAAVGTLDVKRIGGLNRYQTALAVATSAGPDGAGTFDANVSGDCQAVDTVIVVSGQNFPDALAAGALSSSDDVRECGDGRIPLLLTEPTTLRPETAEAINTLDPASVIIVGGPAAVSAAVATAIDGLEGVENVNRIDGANRQETAIDLATVLLDPALGGFDDRFLVTNGLNFPDALAGGVFAGRQTSGGTGSAILLTDSPTSLNSLNATAIKNADGTPPPTILRATLLGGTAAVSDAVKTAVQNAFLARN